MYCLIDFSSFGEFKELAFFEELINQIYINNALLLFEAFDFPNKI